jgi:hypothetical protein
MNGHHPPRLTTSGAAQMKSLNATHLILFAAAVAAQPALAADVVVTPGDMKGWVLTDYRGTGNGYTSNTVGAIDATHAPAGESGSVHMATTDGSGKADFTRLQTDVVTFGDLTSLSYDWYRSSSSTTTQWLTPALRIIYDADGNLADSSDTGYMIFEPVYNVGNGHAATDTWVHEDVLGANFWQRQLSPGVTTFDGPNQIFQTLAGWMTPGQQGNGDLLSASSRVIGINFGVGSGWSDTFDGAVDHVSIGVGGVTTTYNFETAAVAAVPEPSTYALLALGLGMIGFAARRKRQG